MARTFDYPVSGGGGPTSGQTAQQVQDAITNAVAPQALAGNTSAWAANKITLPNTDSITEGTTNLFTDPASVFGTIATNSKITQSGANKIQFSIPDDTTLTDEQVQDIVGAMFQNGTNTTAVYNDTAGTLQINATGGGGGSTFSPTQANLYDGVKAILKAGSQVTIDTDDTNHTLTFNSTASGGTTYTLTTALLRPVLNSVLLVDSTLSKVVSTANNTITLGVASTTPPSGTHTAYFGQQNSNSFASYDTNTATGSADVSASGTTFTTDTSASPRGVLTQDTNWFYILVPADRSLTSLIGPLGNNNLSSFTEITGITINSTAYEARVLQNNGGGPAYNRYVATTE